MDIDTLQSRDSIHLAESDGFIVVLDAAANRYSILGEKRSAQLLEAIPQLRAMRAPAARSAVNRDAFGASDDLPRVSLTALYACSVAAALLHARSLLELVRRASARRRASRVRANVSLEAATREFMATRPVFPRAAVCLFDCMALQEHLAARKHYPLWIFGVSAIPFEAHCWLQQDDVVLNDSVSNVSRYSPILVC